MDDKRILITGASGYIGSNLTAELKKRGFEIHSVSFEKFNPSIKNSYKLNLLDKKEIENFFEEHQFSNLIHLAWYTGKKCQMAPVNFEWLASSLYLIKKFSETGGKTVLVSGSMSEYDFSYGFMKEYETPLNPLSLYGQAKASLYQMTSKYAKSTGLNLKWARIFNLYGGQEKMTRFVPYVINSMLENKEVRVSNCSQILNYLHIQDAASALADFFESPCSGAVNVCADMPVRLKYITELAADLTGFKGKISYGALAPSFEQQFLTGDNFMLKNMTGWQQKFSIEAGIKDTVDFWKEAKPCTAV